MTGEATGYEAEEEEDVYEEEEGAAEEEDRDVGSRLCLLLSELIGTLDLVGSAGGGKGGTIVAAT